MSAKRLLLGVALISALGLTGTAGVTIYGAATTTTADFSLAASPATQSVAPGQTATYAVAVSREKKFTGTVALSVSGQPAGSTPTFTPSTVPSSGTTSSLAIQTTSATDPGTYQLTITGTSGSASRTTSATLVVLSPSQANFALSASPAARVLSDDDNVTYEVGISRSDFPGSVDLSVSGLPKDLTAQFSPDPTVGASSTLTITSPVKPKPGTYTVTIAGSGGGLTRSAAVTLKIEEKRAFQISGAVANQILPGGFAPVELTLTNPHNFPLQVIDLTVTVGKSTSSPGCDGRKNFSVIPIPGSQYPLQLQANQSQNLTQLGVLDAYKPQIVMEDLLGENQDACKGVSYDLSYTGLATR